MLKTLTTTNQTFNSNKKQNYYNEISACSSVSMVFINDRKAYIQATTCIINHTLKSTYLTSTEKLYYLLANFCAQSRTAILGSRETEKSAKEWGQLLNRSEQNVFQMQKNLERLGYFLILREKDEDNQNEKNIITPTLPDQVYDELIKEPDRIGVSLTSFDCQKEYKLYYLDRSKMFIKINLPMLQMVLADPSLSSLQKLIWIYFFSRSYIAYNDQNGEGTRNFLTNYQEIGTMFSCNESTVSVAINKLATLGFITKKQFRLKEQTKLGRRKKKSCWEICALIPEQQMSQLLKQKDRQSLAPLSLDDLKLYYSSSTPINVTQNLPDTLAGSVSLDLKNNAHPAKNEAVSTNSVLLQSELSIASNSYYMEGDPYETKQYNNKNNILNIKNNVIDLSQKTNDSNASPQRSNSVFSEKELLVSHDELAQGLDIAARFEAETFLRPQEELANLEEVIKQVDGTFTTEEHWLVTKTAFTLNQKLRTAVLAQYGVEYDDDVVTKLKEQLFTPAEERLISLWESFSDVPDQSEQEEFLIRKSWLLRLLPNYSMKPKNNQKIQHVPTVKDPSLDLTIPDLPGDKADKAKKFAKKLLTKKLAKGYSASLSIDALAKEMIYHAANWIPARLNCKTREEQIDAALSVAWQAVEKGIWQCPYRLLNMQIQQRELESIRWKSL